MESDLPDFYIYTNKNIADGPSIFYPLLQPKWTEHIEVEELV